MLKAMIEKRIGQALTGEEFKVIAEKVTSDIKLNRIGFGRKTSLDCALDIAERFDVEVEAENLCNMIIQMEITNKKKKTDEANDFTFKAVERCKKLRHEIYR